MEEPISVRYTFMMLLAVADPGGYAIGTDVALARRLNMPLADFKEAICELMKPDTSSNSEDHEGRRVLVSDIERGYFVVNYGKYRDMKTLIGKREYMREYMKQRRLREKQQAGMLTSVNPCKPVLTDVTHSDSDSDSDLTNTTPTPSAALSVSGKNPKSQIPPSARFEKFWSNYPNKKSKGDAVKAWDQKDCEQLFDRIMQTLAAAVKSVDWTKEGGKYVPHPASWLRADGWEDEFKPVRLNIL